MGRRAGRCSVFNAEFASRIVFDTNDRVTYFQLLINLSSNDSFYLSLTSFHTSFLSRM